MSYRAILGNVPHEQGPELEEGEGDHGRRGFWMSWLQDCCQLLARAPNLFPGRWGLAPEMSCCQLRELKDGELCNNDGVQRRMWRQLADCTEFMALLGSDRANGKHVVTGHSSTVSELAPCRIFRRRDVPH